uniref:Uncharacterized protein n=1 Tax=Arundo donax TaxID=35708 RepID=A0A0A9ARA1_ARUDO
MGFMTACARSSLKTPAEGGYDAASATSAMGEDTFTALSMLSLVSAACTLVMAGTSCAVTFLAVANTSLPTAMPWICVAG